jgi:hypothetical protein
MKSLLLAICIAALATPANARPWAAFYCGKDQIALLPPKYFLPNREMCDPCDGKEHYFVMKKGEMNKRALSNRLFRMGDDGTLFYKGKKCRDFTDKDYDALE